LASQVKERYGIETEVASRSEAGEHVRSDVAGAGGAVKD
jgi:hypothetical protein